MICVNLTISAENPAISRLISIHDKTTTLTFHYSAQNSAGRAKLRSLSINDSNYLRYGDMSGNVTVAYEYHVLCIPTVTFPGESVVGDALHSTILSRPRSSQPTLTGWLICRIPVEAITLCSAQAFLLTCCDRGRRMSDFSRRKSCVLLSSPVRCAAWRICTYSTSIGINVNCKPQNTIKLNKLKAYL